MCTDCFEIAWADRTEVCKRSTGGILSREKEVRIPPVRNVVERKMTDCADSSDARQCRELCLKVLMECVCGGLGIQIKRWGQAKRQRAVPVITGVQPLNGDERANHQT